MRKIKNTLLGVLASAMIFYGCREVPLTPEPNFSKEAIKFGPKSKMIETQNGQFEIAYYGEGGIGPFDIDIGHLLIIHHPDTILHNLEVDTYENNKVWLTKKGPTKNHSEYDPLILVRYAGRFNLEAYLITPEGP